MKTILEHLLLVGGTIYLWGKLGSIALGLGLILYGCYRFNKALASIHSLRSYSCQ